MPQNKLKNIAIIYITEWDIVALNLISYLKNIHTAKINNYLYELIIIAIQE